MKLTTRIDRLEQRASAGEPVKLTIAFLDSVLNGTISDEEFARWVPALREIWRDGPFEAAPFEADAAGASSKIAAGANDDD
jgi:hypothetical protein